MLTCLNELDEINKLQRRGSKLKKPKYPTKHFFSKNAATLEI
jgi:hypothetical protein